MRKEASVMLPYEDSGIEYKQEYVDDIRKEVVAFANSEGGLLVVGVRKDRSVVGVKDPDATMVRLANMLRDAISPDIMPFVRINSRELDGLPVIELEVSVGTNRPYYIREKGLRPSGVYIRRGSSSQPVSDEGIREMILATSGRAFESCRSMNQELTFDALKQALKRKSLAYGKAQLRTLKLIGEDGLYTNLALLLSDQCEVTTKVAVFQGSVNAVFRDRAEFSGSLLRQLEEVYHHIDLLNRTQADFSGLERIDRRDYPEEALREALLNAFVHRDYAFSGSTIINVYEDRIEFVSLGGLVPGLELASIFLGVSQSRNPALASLFYRLKLIESYGTGIGRILRAYSDQSRKPVFETEKGVFRVTLPSRASIPNGRATSAPAEASFLSADSERILAYVQQHGGITRKGTETLLGIGQTKANRLLRQLREAGILSMVGRSRCIEYILKDDRTDV